MFFKKPCDPPKMTLVLVLRILNQDASRVEIKIPFSE